MNWVNFKYTVRPRAAVSKELCGTKRARKKCPKIFRKRKEKDCKWKMDEETYAGVLRNELCSAGGGGIRREKLAARELAQRAAQNPLAAGRERGPVAQSALFSFFFCGLREAAQVPVLRAGATETQVGGPRAFRGQRCLGCLDFVLSAGYGSGGQSVQPNQGTLHVRDYLSTSQVPHHRFQASRAKHSNGSTGVRSLRTIASTAFPTSSASDFQSCVQMPQSA